MTARFNVEILVMHIWQVLYLTFFNLSYFCVCRVYMLAYINVYTVKPLEFVDASWVAPPSPKKKQKKKTTAVKI